MKKQDKNGPLDLRHLDRDPRVRKLRVSKGPAKQPAEIPPATALVIGVGAGSCLVAENNTTTRIRCDLPVAPGDLVSIRHEKVIAIGPRRSTLARTDPANKHRERVIAANIDLLVIVAAIDDPPFRPGLVDRYLIAAARGGVQPLLCVNKADSTSPERIAAAVHPFAIPWVACSTRTGAGIGELRGFLTGKLSVFAGHSGVGKSSLLNALAGTVLARTGDVSEGTGKGQHTTTSSSLVDVGDHARVIDTPGIRAFDPGRLTLSELNIAFPEFANAGCHFGDCSHQAEPGCAVRDAASPRYASWLRLAAELSAKDFVCQRKVESS